MQFRPKMNKKTLEEKNSFCSFFWGAGASAPTPLFLYLSCFQFPTEEFDACIILEGREQIKHSLLIIFLKIHPLSTQVEVNRFIYKNKSFSWQVVIFEFSLVTTPVYHPLKLHCQPS